jgi:hypothetical protein
LPHTLTPTERRIETSSIAKDLVRPMCAELTATALGPINPWCFVAPCDCGLGLFARTLLLPNQVVSEYGGPRLPKRLATKGVYLLKADDQTTIDGMGENSPFEYAPYPAIFANDSATVPNARLETWRLKAEKNSLLPAERLVLVTNRLVRQGEELRFNYEGGDSSYWRDGTRPRERGEWRRTVIETPPPVMARRIIAPPVEISGENFQDGELLEALDELAPVEGVIPWGGPAGGDARLRVLMGMLDPQGKVTPAKPGLALWRTVCTHLPGRTGAECRDRWRILCRKRDTAGWAGPAVQQERARQSAEPGGMAVGSVMGKQTGASDAAWEGYPAREPIVSRVAQQQARQEGVVRVVAAQRVGSLPEGDEEQVEGDGEEWAEQGTESGMGEESEQGEQEAMETEVSEETDRGEEGEMGTGHDAWDEMESEQDAGDEALGEVQEEEVTETDGDETEGEEECDERVWQPAEAQFEDWGMAAAAVSEFGSAEAHWLDSGRGGAARSQSVQPQPCEHNDEQDDGVEWI